MAANSKSGVRGNYRLGKAWAGERLLPRGLAFAGGTTKTRNAWGVAAGWPKGVGGDSHERPVDPDPCRVAAWPFVSSSTYKVEYTSKQEATFLRRPSLQANLTHL